jgi:hypothetical protein
VPPLPRIARRISGSEYRLGENPFGWKTLTPIFYPDRDTMAVFINGAQRVTIRLDHLYAAPDEAEPNLSRYRGRWEDEETFVVEEIRIGELAEYEYRLTFTGGEMTITAQDRVFGGAPVELHGTRR